MIGARYRNIAVDNALGPIRTADKARVQRIPSHGIGRSKFVNELLNGNRVEDLSAVFARE